MEKKWYELMEMERKKQEVERVLACNEKTEKFGLTLTAEEAEKLMVCRHDALRNEACGIWKGDTAGIDRNLL